jgi:hypothetical protein
MGITLAALLQGDDMAFVVTAKVTRNDLGLTDLNINDHVNYSLSASIMGGTVSWERREATSPWVDGSVTTARRRQKATETMQVNVYGGTQSELLDNMRELVEAFSQNSYTLKIVLKGTDYHYACEAADYSVEWGYKMHSEQAMVTFQVPRHPTPKSDKGV